MFCQLGTSSSAAKLTTADEDGVIKLGLHEDRDPALVHWLKDVRMELSTLRDRVKPLLTFRMPLFVVVQVE